MIDIKTATFKGGIHPLHSIHHGKGFTNKLPIKDADAPKIAVYPMSQHIGAPCEPNVKVGDRVLIGQEIGSMKGFVSAPIHASVSGTVKAIEQRLTISGSPVISVVVENDFKDEWIPEIKERENVKDLTAAEIKEIIKNCGIVGLGGASFPTHVKLSPAEGLNADYIILNGAECEPYLTSDHRMMLEQPKKIAGGLNLLLKAMDCENGVIAVENNKKDAMEALKPYLSQGMRIQPLKVKYPQGSEKQLINAVTGREVPSGGLPIAVGCVVVNVSTAAAVYDAVYSMRPIIDTVITVVGAVKEPKNLKARVGTPLIELVEQCGGLLDGVEKVISGGPMMGMAIYDLNVPAQKSTSGILALTKKDMNDAQKTQCIRCGRCAQGCPMHLQPMLINRLSAMKNWDGARAHNALDCIECGSCSYNCPAKLDITSNIRAAKRAILAASRKK